MPQDHFDSRSFRRRNLLMFKNNKFYHVSTNWGVSTIFTKTNIRNNKLMAILRSIFLLWNLQLFMQNQIMFKILITALWMTTLYWTDQDLSQELRICCTKLVSISMSMILCNQLKIWLANRQRQKKDEKRILARLSPQISHLKTITQPM
jgi:hypothetical protein